jgi:hypothetical protein
MLEMLVFALKIGALAYAGFCLLLFFRQSSYMYYPDKNVAATPDAIGLRFEDVRLKTQDGVAISVWHVPAASNAAAARTILYLHGNAGNNGHRLDALLALHDLGVNVLMPDYRGYGNSSGEPSEKGTYLDALAAWEFLTRDRDIPAERIVILGRSLGGAVASWLALEVQPGGLVLEASFTSARDMVSKVFPIAPRWLCRFKYDSLARMPKLKCPVLIAHSPNDEMVPYEHGRRLFAAACEPKSFVELTGDHNAGESELEPQYRAALVKFIDGM